MDEGLSCDQVKKLFRKEIYGNQMNITFLLTRIQKYLTFDRTIRLPLAGDVPLKILLLLCGGVILLLLIILIVRALRPLPKRIESKIRKKKYMSVEEFLESWKEDKSDFPGCYVVLIYEKRLIINPMNYDDIYVGQSVNVRKRVFSHVMGRGNGNVYYGYRSGYKMYVIIRKCRKKKLNKAEIDLINYFGATDSINMTRGGAAKR